MMNGGFHNYLPGIVLALLFFGLPAVYGQKIVFERITTDYTNSIMPDSDGFVWIGTQDGILRYDGNEFKAFRYDPADSLSISDNFVWGTVQDKWDRIWIGTFNGGLSMWNKYTEKFTTFYLAPPTLQNAEINSVRTLHLQNDSTLILGTERGVMAFDLHTTSFVSGGIWDKLKAMDWFTYSITATHSDHLLVATETGLYEVQLTTGAIQLVDLPGDDTQTITDLRYQGQTLYIGSELGMYRTDDLRTFEDHLTTFGETPLRVHRIFIDSHDDIWIATESGLGRFRPGEGYSWFRHDKDDQFSLKTNIIHCIQEVEPGIIMAGTRQGVHQFSTQTPLFHGVGRRLADAGCSRTTLGMTEDHNGDIWICTRGGLLHIGVTEDINDWAIRCYTPENTPGMLNEYTVNITRDTNDDLWLGYRKNGLSRISMRGESLVWTQYPKTTALFNGEGVNQIFQDSDGQYWLATRGFGLMQFFPDQDSVVAYGADLGLSHPYLFRIYEDSRQQMWIATAGGGLCLFDRVSKSFECSISDRRNRNSLSSNMVLAISEDSRKRLWVCTVDGLNIMEGERDRFAVLTTANGLPNDVIYAAMEDRRGGHWVSTSDGIVRVQFDGGVNSLEVFGLLDGIPGMEGNQHSFLEHSSGLLLFGGVDGIAVLNPDEVQPSEYYPEVALTDFMLFNESVPVAPVEDPGGFSLDTNINDTRRVVLKYNENTVALRFTALGYAKSKIGSYRYMMEGLDDDWITRNDARYASYPRIPPGHYVFKANVSNRDGVWNPRPKMLEIEVLPPPWKTWWAYTLYAFLVLAALYTIVWFQSERTRAIERAKAAERDRFRKKMARDFHDEAGNKITIMSLLTDRVRKKVTNGNETAGLLGELEQTIQELRAGMRDFIWIMDPSRDTLFDTVVRFRDFAEKVCQQAEVRFVERGRAETLRDVAMPGNMRRHFLLIFKEALNNTLKYANASKVVFTVRKSDTHHWIFTLEDDGAGFDLNGSSTGYGLKNMAARAAQIGSKFKIDTKPGAGTRVTLLWDSQLAEAQPTSVES